MDTGPSGSVSAVPLIPFQTSAYSPGYTKNPECYQGILKSYLLQHDQVYRKTKQKFDVKVSRMQNYLTVLLLLF